jgi:hypothetical protein
MKVRDKAYWTTLTCQVNERPVIESEIKKLCLLAFKIKATETTNGVFVRPVKLYSELCVASI